MATPSSETMGPIDPPPEEPEPITATGTTTEYPVETAISTEIYNTLVLDGPESGTIFTTSTRITSGNDAVGVDDGGLMTGQINITPVTTSVIVITTTAADSTTIIPESTISTATLFTPTATPTILPLPHRPNALPPATPFKFSTGTLIGIAVGASVGLIILISAITVCCLRLRKRRHARHKDQTELATNSQSPVVVVEGSFTRGWNISSQRRRNDDSHPLHPEPITAPTSPMTGPTQYPIFPGTAEVASGFPGPGSRRSMIREDGRRNGVLMHAISKETANQERRAEDARIPRPDTHEGGQIVRERFNRWKQERGMMTVVDEKQCSRGSSRSRSPVPSLSIVPVPSPPSGSTFDPSQIPQRIYTPVLLTDLPVPTYTTQLADSPTTIIATGAVSSTMGFEDIPLETQTDKLTPKQNSLRVTNPDVEVAVGGIKRMRSTLDAWKTGSVPSRSSSSASKIPIPTRNRNTTPSPHRGRKEVPASMRIGAGLGRVEMDEEIPRVVVTAPTPTIGEGVFEAQSLVAEGMAGSMGKGMTVKEEELIRKDEKIKGKGKGERKGLRGRSGGRDVKEESAEKGAKEESSDSVKRTGQSKEAGSRERSRGPATFEEMDLVRIIRGDGQIDRSDL